MVSRKLVSSVLLVLLMVLAPSAWAAESDAGLTDWLSQWIHALFGGASSDAAASNTSSFGGNDDPEHYNYMPPGG